MPTLLQIDSSPLGEASVSRKLTHSFAQHWKTLNPDGKILTRDLTTTHIQPVTAEWIGARMNGAGDSPEQANLLKLSEELIAELKTADEYVFGVPMYNFGIPAVLKLWIDQIARPGRTFSYASGKPVGLLTGKRATFLIASGGTYDSGTAMAPLNFAEPYLRAVFAFLGVTDTTFINAGGTMAVAYGKVDLPSFLQPHIESIQQALQPA
jgi:FMN-dependent NADH-azoreductase